MAPLIPLGWAYRILQSPAARFGVRTAALGLTLTYATGLSHQLWHDARRLDARKPLVQPLRTVGELQVVEAKQA